MRRKTVETLVFEALFPCPRAEDPQDFGSFLRDKLVYEVRQEVHSFYGHIDDLESKYPGLDYCHTIHRIRLSRWPWHRRLFRAFDMLRLTPAEIYSLTKWEGTKWAKERYEREQGVTIRDTTADTFPDWIEPEDRTTPSAQSDQETEDEEQAGHRPASAAVAGVRIRVSEGLALGSDGSESEDEVQSSVGFELNERLRRRVAAHNAGDTSQPLDEEWEQWLKNAIETGELRMMADEISQPPTRLPTEVTPQRLLIAARAGQWDQIPDSLQDMLRRSFAHETSPPSSSRVPGFPGGSATEPGTSDNPAWRRTLSGLRLPDSRRATASSHVQQRARASGA